MAASDYVPIFFKNRLHLAGRPQMSSRPSRLLAHDECISASTSAIAAAARSRLRCITICLATLRTRRSLFSRFGSTAGLALLVLKHCTSNGCSVWRFVATHAQWTKVTGAHVGTTADGEARWRRSGCMLFCGVRCICATIAVGYQRRSPSIYCVGAQSDEPYSVL
jgi:hypothetical protein